MRSQSILSVCLMLGIVSSGPLSAALLDAPTLSGDGY